METSNWNISRNRLNILQSFHALIFLLQLKEVNIELKSKTSAAAQKAIKKKIVSLNKRIIK